MHLHTKYQQNSSLHNGNIQIKPICTHILTMKNKDGRRSNIKRPIQKPVGYVKHNVLQYLHIEYQVYIEYLKPLGENQTLENRPKT